MIWKREKRVIFWKNPKSAGWVGGWVPLFRSPTKKQFFFPMPSPDINDKTTTKSIFHLCSGKGVPSKWLKHPQ